MCLNGMETITLRERVNGSPKYGTIDGEKKGGSLTNVSSIPCAERIRLSVQNRTLISGFNPLYFVLCMFCEPTAQ